MVLGVASPVRSAASPVLVDLEHLVVWEAQAVRAPSAEWPVDLAALPLEAVGESGRRV